MDLLKGACFSRALLHTHHPLQHHVVAIYQHYGRVWGALHRFQSLSMLGQGVWLVES